jgi:acyl-CoA synthetase (AMP-forming)/AMP-acid ligase II
VVEESRRDRQTLELCSSGRPPAEVLVRVVHPETRVECAEAEVGELWVRSASVARGYWRQPQQTHETFAATPSGGEADEVRSGSLAVRASLTYLTLTASLGKPQRAELEEQGVCVWSFHIFVTLTRARR